MLGKFFKRWSPPAPDLLPQPEQPLLVVGDVHGCRGQMDRLLNMLQADPVLRTASARLIFVGDLMDRGPDSAGVLDAIRAMQGHGPWQVEALMGNHEAMCLDFLDADPAEQSDPAQDEQVATGLAAAARWLLYGGRETLESFGVAVPDPLDLDDPDMDALLKLRNATRAAMGADRIDWLRNRPRWIRSGDVVVVHAAWDRAEDDDAQDPDTLIWGARGFLGSRHTVPPWIVHGHTITRPAAVHGTRIAVDSGAYLSGDLTCAVLLPGQAPRLISTIPSEF